MDPDEIFKRFFGTSFSEFGHQPFRPVPDEDRTRSSHGEFHHGSDLFGDLHLHLHQQMEEMDKQMQEAFRIFTIPSHTPSVIPSLPGGDSESGPRTGSNVREQMLKEREGSVQSPQSSDPQPSRPSFEGFFSPWFKDFHGSPQIPPSQRRDSDLDGEKPSNDDIVDMYSQKRDPVGSFFGGSRSMRVQTIVGADGVVEERRTVTDSSGREETSVTRRIGDQSHTVTTVRDKQGVEEKQEVFQNIDADKMAEFDKQWQGQGKNSDPRVLNPETALRVPSTPGGALSDNRGFFRKLFGF